MGESIDEAVPAAAGPGPQGAGAAGAGGPQEQAKPTLLKVAAARQRELQALLAGDHAGFSVDAVHDLRVSTRRLTEVVGLFEPLMDGAMADAAEGSLRTLRKAAGDLRDLDVMEEHLDRARLPAAVKPVATAIRADYPDRRRALVGRLLETTAAASVSGAMVYLARLFEELAAKEAAVEKKLAAVLAKRIKRRRKQVKTAFGEAAMEQTPAALHDARIAVKKLRYVLELADETGAVGDDGLGRELKMLKGIQKLLGEHHDVHVIQEVLAAHLPGDPAAKGLRAAWAAFSKKIAHEQAGRAAEFFRKAYLWNQR